MNTYVQQLTIIINIMLLTPLKGASKQHSLQSQTNSSSVTKNNKRMILCISETEEVSVLKPARVLASGKSVMWSTKFTRSFKLCML